TCVPVGPTPVLVGRTTVEGAACGGRAARCSGHPSGAVLTRGRWGRGGGGRRPGVGGHGVRGPQRPSGHGGPAAIGGAWCGRTRPGQRGRVRRHLRRGPVCARADHAVRSRGRGRPYGRRTLASEGFAVHGPPGTATGGPARAPG